MKLKKIGVSILSGALAMMILGGCGSSESSSDAQSDPGTSQQTESKTDESKGDESVAEGYLEKFNVKLLGRTYYNDGALWLGLSGTGADFDFTGDTLKINMIGNPAGMDSQPI